MNVCGDSLHLHVHIQHAMYKFNVAGTLQEIELQGNVPIQWQECLPQEEYHKLLPLHMSFASR